MEGGNPSILTLPPGSSKNCSNNSSNNPGGVGVGMVISLPSVYIIYIYIYWSQR
jgi:hypothetical protein